MAASQATTLADTVGNWLPATMLLAILCGVWWMVRRRERRLADTPFYLQDAPQAYHGPLAFFRRHWNGDYSLARSYWVNNLLVSLFAPLLGVLLLPWLGNNFPARYASAGVLAVTGLGLLAWCWAAAGTWASAAKHASRGGRQGWATAAQIMICLGFLKTCTDVARLLPPLQEHARVALGAQAGPDTTVELRTGGRSILLSGGINDGSAALLDEALAKAPHTVDTVVFNSAGGWLREGDLLAAVVRRRGLNTYVEGYCASACTIAFLAGKERAADPRALIGFHASRSVGAVAARPTAAESARLRAVYRDAGLPEAFIAKALDTPHEAMWHPTVDEMLDAGVLTRRSMGGETAKYSTAIRSREQAAEEFKKTDAFAAIAEHAPKEFDRIVDAAWAKLRAGASDVEVATAARAQFSAILPAYLPQATDATLIAYHELVLQELKIVRGKDAAMCVEMLYPSGKPVNPLAVLPAEMLARELSLTAQVMREADPARAPKPDRQALQQVAVRATQGMTTAQLNAISSDSARAASPAPLVCDATIAFFSGLGRIPPAERGKALRMVFANG